MKKPIRFGNEKQKCKHLAPAGLHGGLFASEACAQHGFAAKIED
jgi:hypothetical protein